MLIRLRGCAGWSAPLLFAHGINRFSHENIIVITLIFCGLSTFTVLERSSVSMWKSLFLNIIECLTSHYVSCKQVAQRATIAHLSPMCQGQISFQKIQTHPSFNACSCYMKVSKGSNQKQQRKSGKTIFPIIRSIGVFLRRSRAANSVVGGPIWPKFELIHNIMHVLVTSKFEKDRININRDYVMT